MTKKIMIPGLIIAAIVIVSALSIQNELVESSIKFQDNNVENLKTVIMPTKSSRPGCDETNTCYIPSKISIRQGESITWLNEDAAFHSVTSALHDQELNLMFEHH